jgi:hypothetical protein
VRQLSGSITLSSRPRLARLSRAGKVYAVGWSVWVAPGRFELVLAEARKLVTGVYIDTVSTGRRRTTHRTIRIG